MKMLMKILAPVKRPAKIPAGQANVLLTAGLLLWAQAAVHANGRIDARDHGDTIIKPVVVVNSLENQPAQATEQMDAQPTPKAEEQPKGGNEADSEANAAAAREEAFANLAGNYKGNVRNRLLGLGNISKDGRLKISKAFGNIEIACWSKDHDTINNTFTEQEVHRYFSSPDHTEVIQLDDGTEEVRVEFEHITDVHRNLVGRLLKGSAQLTTSYQFRFHGGTLTSFRVQQQSSAHKDKLKYLLEVKKAEKMLPVVNRPKVRNGVTDPRKKDWDF